jgi:nitroreductase
LRFKGELLLSINENPVLKTIKERRSINRFKPDDIPEDKLEAILEAGRAAPSWTDTQPWKFIVVKNPETRRKLTELSLTVTGIGIKEAPVDIVIVVDPKVDPYRHVEDGAAATQNMSLAAQSLGLGSFWVGVPEKGLSADRIKKLLGIPKSHRVISILPIGVPALTPSKTGKTLSEIVYKESFGKN